MMDNNKIFHPDLVARAIETSEKLCAEQKQVFRPQIVSALGFDPESQEACCMVSLMFSMELVAGYKLSKGKNGGLKRIEETTTTKNSDSRKCSKCGSSGHNARSPQKCNNIKMLSA